MHSSEAILGPQGPFAEGVPRFAARPAQQELAAAVELVLAEQGVLVAEAGTGTGKTYAYLVPALLSGRKVVVSTGTKNLQDQLFHRDLPVVREVLGVPVRVALLKGRANYLCLHRLDRAEADGRFASREAAGEIVAIRAWAGHTQSGDRAEQAQVPEDSSVWPRVTSTADNCLGTDCPRLRDCFLVHARREAQEAELVVVNHHLLLSDISLREEGFGEVLPAADAFIVDEAHQLPEVAAQFFGTVLGGNQLIELARDAVLEYQREAGETRDLARLADVLTRAVRELRLAFGNQPRRLPWERARDAGNVPPAVSAVRRALEALRAALEPLGVRGKGLESCAKRAAELLARFDLLTGDAPEDQIHWLDVHTRSFALHHTPLDISERFRSHLDTTAGAWVFTSATLAVAGGFDHFVARLGIEDAQSRVWDSPFDYPRQALLYHPPGLPDPGESGYTEAVVKAALPVLEASRGRAFLLFTSHRALAEAAVLLQGRLPYPLLAQGEAPRDVLLSRFRQAGDAVLLGTSSFWEGVDVRGEALSCVIIDKLPFASPGDPVLQARLDAVRRQGGNPFRDHQLPQAVIALKQGAGRLIRDVSDRGVLMVCDPRLRSRSYGAVFLASLPPMRRTSRLEAVQTFFAADGESAAAEPEENS